MDAPWDFVFWFHPHRWWRIRRRLGIFRDNRLSRYSGFLMGLRLVFLLVLYAGPFSEEEEEEEGGGVGMGVIIASYNKCV